MTQNYENYFPSGMKAFRAKHLRGRGAQIVQVATLAKPLGLEAASVKVQVRATGAGLGVLDMLQLHCPVDAVLGSVSPDADPFGSTLAKTAGEWTEATMALGPKASAACQVVADHTGDNSVRETPTD